MLQPGGENVVRIVKQTALISAAATVAAACLASAQTIEMRAPLEPETMTGIVLDGGALCLPEPLPTQRGGDAIAVEAEAFDTVQWQDGKAHVVDTDGAGGGRAISHASEALYRFVITRAGYYHYWERVWIPRRATWNHHVQIDDRMPAEYRFGARKGDEAESWFWVGEAPRLYLKPGVHTLAVRNLHNGKRLDRWVLTQDADWRPEGTGPEAAPIRQFDEGTFVSAPFAPLSLASWSRLDVSGNARSRIEFSLGGGAFQPLPADGALYGSATPLVVRVQLRREDDGLSPRVRLGEVQFEAPQADFAVLEGESMQLVLHRASGRICGLRERETGRRFMPDGTPGALFALDFKAENNPEIRRVWSDDAQLTELSARRGRATLQYELVRENCRVKIDIDLRKDWMGRFVLTVENSSSEDVVGVVFPCLPGVRAGGDSGDDVLCFPSMSGRLIPRPGTAGTVTNTHPMRTTIGYCDLHDTRGGLTLAPLDSPMVLTEFSSEAATNRQSTALTLTRRDRVPAGDSRRFTAGVGLHAGDWHTAADWYRDWFTKTFGEPDIPDWVVDSDGWVTSADAEDMAGLGFTHIQMWMQTGFAGCPTYYLPNPAYRSEAQFRELASSWRSLGGHLGVYYHGNGMSRSYILADRIYGIPISQIPPDKRPPSWEWFVHNAGYGPERKPVERLDMSEIPEPAKKEEYPTMCWQAGNWTDYLEKWAIDIWLKEYGFDTPYWDTLACRDRAEFNPYYGLNGEGRGAMARYEFLRRMQDLGERQTEGFYQIVEGGSELLGLQAGQLQSNFVKNLEVGRYTHPDQVYYIGHSNGWWNPPKTHLAACMAFYLNTKLDLIRLHPEVMEVVRTRRWFAPWLYHSRFMDTLGLSISDGAVKGALHQFGRGRDRAILVTFMNWQSVGGAKAAVDLERYLPRRSRAVGFVVTQGVEPRPADLDFSGAAVTLDVPTSPVSAYLILADPRRAAPVAQAWQADTALHIRVFDPAGEARTLNATVDTAEARFVVVPELGDRDDRFILRSDDAAADNPVMFGRALRIQDYSDLEWRRHADILLRGRGVRLQTRALIAPYFEDPDFESERYDTDEAHTGKRSLKLTPSARLSHFPLNLVPGRRYRVSVWVKRLEKKGGVYANIHHHKTNSSHIFGHGAPVGEWHRLETTYTMKAGSDQPHLYLYNWQGATQPVWYDSVQVEDLGPAQ
jgi:hypothetical protein